MKSAPLFEIVKTTLGATSIRNNVVNEIMHNPVGPWEESNQLYIEQSELTKKLCDPFLLNEPLTIFDVGLGAAANAVAALHTHSSALKSNKRCRYLRLVSFEIDLRLLEFTLENQQHFPQILPYSDAIKNLLSKGYWESDAVTWLLRKGDFTKLITQENETAELIFYDAYSPKVNPEMWGYKCFKELIKKCHNTPSHPCSLFTYSRSTPVRSALLAAGFYIGQGRKTGLKSETTQASTIIDELHAPLGLRWLERWKRSSSPLPNDKDRFTDIDFNAAVLNHHQFSHLSSTP